MRIVHVVTRSHRRGAEIVAIELADALDALGHDDEVVAMALAVDGNVDPRLPPLVHAASIGPVAMLRGGWRLRRKLSASPADAVIAHGGSPAQVTAFALWRTPGRLVWQRILGIPERAWHGLRGSYWRALARRFDAAVVISPELEREMERLAFRGPIWMIPNARDPARFETVDRYDAAARLHAEIDVHEDVFLVGFVGHLVAQKQPEVAVDILDLLRRDGCDAHLVIAGDGPLRSSVEQRVVEHGLQSFVTLLGHRDDIEWVYGGVDLVVITSESEGVPGVVIEAQMAGCPVVSFPVGSVGQVIDNLETGIVVDQPDVGSMASAVAGLLADEPARLAMGKLGRDGSAKYSTAKTALVFDERLRHLVNDGAPP
jgi:glycosyltransferase involved in cell wall biosynthesis